MDTISQFVSQHNASHCPFPCRYAPSILDSQSYRSKQPTKGRTMK